jgi:DNA-binding NarL/FixJ family response regulator
MARAHKRIRVVICNKYVLFREGIKSVVREGTLIEIGNEADTAIDQAARLKPDVALTDLVTQCLSGPEVVRPVKAAHPNVRFQAGVPGYVRKDDRPSRLRRTIDAVCRFGEYRSQRAGTA